MWGPTKAERKLDLEGWSRSRLEGRGNLPGEDRVSAPARRHLRGGDDLGGGTLLLARLGRLTKRHIRDLFEGARFADYAEASGPSRDVGHWVRAFQEKVRQITDRAPCPVP